MLNHATHPLINHIRHNLTLDNNMDNPGLNNELFKLTNKQIQYIFNNQHTTIKHIRIHNNGSSKD